MTGASEERDEFDDLLEIPDQIALAVDALAMRGASEGSLAAADALLPFGTYPRGEAGAMMAQAADHLRTWAALYREANVRPLFGHMTLMRSAVETASTVRWLIAGGVSPQERIARGLGHALDGLNEGRLLENAATRRGHQLVAEGGRSSASRADEIRKGAARISQPIVQQSHTYLVSTYGPGEFEYRLLCAFAHGVSRVTLMASQRTIHSELSPDGSERIRLQPDEAIALKATRDAVSLGQVAVMEFGDYLGASTTLAFPRDAGA